MVVKSPGKRGFTVMVSDTGRVMNAIDATALAIFFFEGANLANPTTRNIRNLNPGNLRPYLKTQTTDGDGYRTFQHFADGWHALIGDITTKVTVHLKPTDTMEQLFDLYAPGADHNDPHGYAQYVCGWLSSALGKSITLSTTIAEIFGTPTT